MDVVVVDPLGFIKKLLVNRTFNSVNEAANYVGKKPCSITSACKGYDKTCGGYHWKYALEDVNKEIIDKVL